MRIGIPPERIGAKARANLFVLREFDELALVGTVKVDRLVVAAETHAHGAARRRWGIGVRAKSAEQAEMYVKNWALRKMVEQMFSGSLYPA